MVSRTTRDKAHRIIVVDDDRDICELLKETLAEHNYDAVLATHHTEVEAHLREPLEAAVVDVVLDGASGVDLCRQIRRTRPDVPIVMITAADDSNIAIRALRAGAFDFISKPFSTADLVAALDRAIARRRVELTVKQLHSTLHDSATATELIGRSPSMRKIHRMIERIADNDATVLITGESGTGKDLIARAIHQASPRSAKPYRALNCATHETLLESELFGHVKGAFTDAHQTKPGMFVDAEGGTLFLDEIGELPLDTQPKLLRVLQERAVRPVGADYELPFDARIIAATNRDLSGDVAAGRFREDLYYRIDVVRIEMPPLRERGDDVLLLAQHFVEQHAAATGKKVDGLTPEAANRLMAYNWPGNVRELENVIARAVTLTRFEQVTAADLPPRLIDPPANNLMAPRHSIDELPTLDEVAASYIRKVLDGVDGNKTRAAEILGLNRRTLYRRVKRLDIEAGDGAAESVSS